MAQTKSALTGTVIDQDGQPLPGVSVSLTSEVLIGGAQDKVTNNGGGFKFTLLPPGAYHLEASLDGFVSNEIDAESASTATLRFASPWYPMISPRTSW